MNIDMLAVFRNYGIKIADTSDKHSSPGWLNVDCPFCADTKKHLGWNIKKQFFHCWKCGAHSINDVLAELLGVPYYELDAIRQRYALRPAALADDDKPEAVKIRAEQIVVPGGYLELRHREYLLNRGYDPGKLVKLWGLRATDHLAAGTDKFRVVCPIYHDGKVVSWQGRDITGKSPLRWKSCAAEYELRAHKHCLGGSQLVPGDSVAVVEGFTDAWRLGAGSVATFGTSYLAPQINLLRKYRRRFVVLDSEEKDPNARAQADRLAAVLSAFPGETVMVELDEGDPGDLDQDEADRLMTTEWRIRK